jgi:hypothetical protein
MFSLVGVVMDQGVDLAGTSRRLKPTPCEIRLSHVRSDKEFNYLADVARVGWSRLKGQRQKNTNMNVNHGKTEDAPGAEPMLAGRCRNLPSAEEISKRIGDRLPPVRYKGPVVVPPHAAGI